MNASTLVKVILVTTIIWISALGPSIWNAYEILDSAPGYRKAELLVENASCADPRTELGPKNRTYGERTPLYCSLDGTIDGKSVSLDTNGSSEELPLSAAGLLQRYPPGSRVHVLYNPDAPTFGLNYQSIAALWPSQDLEEGLRREIADAFRLVVISLASIVALFAAVVAGARRRSRETGSYLEIDQGRPWQGWGLGIAAFGLTLILTQVTGTTAGTAGFGALLAASGSALLIRRWMHVKRTGREITLGHHLFGFPFRRRRRRLASRATVRLTGHLPPHVEIEPADGGAPVVLLKARNTEGAVLFGERVARFLGTSLQDPFKHSREKGAGR